MLADLANQMEFALRTIVHPAGWQIRTISGADILEEGGSRQAEQLDGSLIITTGAGLEAPEDRLVFIEQLHANGACALLFVLGRSFASVPPEIIAACESRELPLLVSPETTSVGEILSFVYRSVGNDDHRLYKRLTGIQRYLIDALGSRNAEETIIRRIARACSSTVAILAGEEILNASATIPARRITEYLRSQPPTMVEWAEPGWRAIATPIENHSLVRHWLIVVQHGDGMDSALVRGVLEAAAPLFTALGTLGSAARAQERAVRAGVLHAVLEAESPMDRRFVTQRAEAMGVNFRDPVHIWVIGHLPRARKYSRVPETIAQLQELIDERLEGALITFLSLERSSDVVLLTQADEETMLALMTELLEERKDLVVALSSTVESIAAVQSAVVDASLLLRMPSTKERLRRTSSMRLSTFLIARSDPQEIQRHAEALLAEVLAQPILSESLDAYLDHHFDVPRAAESLKIHANTMRYRIERLEQVFGSSLRNPALLADVVLARIWYRQQEASRLVPGSPKPIGSADRSHDSTPTTSTDASATQALQSQYPSMPKGAARAP